MPERGATVITKAGRKLRVAILAFSLLASESALPRTTPVVGGSERGFNRFSFGERVRVGSVGWSP